MSKKIYKNVALCVVGSLFLYGCATPNLSGPQNTFNEDVSQLLEGEARVVIFRDEDTYEKVGTPMVRIDDMMVGALHPGQYSTARICQGSNQLKITPAIPGTNPFLANLRAKAGEVVYVRMWEADEERLEFEVLTAEEAGDYLSDSDYVSFLKNRKQQGCKPVLLREVALEADALFRFDSSALSDILGRQALDVLAKDIIQNDIKVDRIKVVGHTDRLGSEEYNFKLSEERAAKIAEYLRLKGVLGLIEIEGMGASDPVTKGCQGKYATPALVECLQPDRRVSIELWGIKVEESEDLTIGGSLQIKSNAAEVKAE